MVVVVVINSELHYRCLLDFIHKQMKVKNQDMKLLIHYFTIVSQRRRDREDESETSSLKVAAVLCPACWLVAVAGLVTGWWNLRMWGVSHLAYLRLYIPALTTVVICRVRVEL